MSLLQPVANDVAASATFEAFAHQLATVIGELGVSALLARALQLTRRNFLWLNGAPDTPHGNVAQQIVSLRSCLDQRERSEAEAAGLALLRNFVTLMTNLIGTALTERLINANAAEPLPEPVVAPLPSSQSTQESEP